MRMRGYGLVGVILSWIACAPAAGQEWRASRVWVTGSHSSAWVLGQSEAVSGSLPVVQMWWAGPSATRDALPMQSVSTLPPISGGISVAASDAGALRVMYSDLSTADYFGDRPWSPGARWRDQSDRAPLAWGGDTAESVMYAVVEGSALLPVSTRPADADELDGEGKTAASAPAVPPIEGIALLTLRNGIWSRVAAAKDTAGAADFCVTGRRGEVWLFWRMEQRIRAASFSKGAWSAAEDVATGKDFRGGWAGFGEEGPVFIAGLRREDGDVALHVFLRSKEGWRDEGAARDGTEVLTVDPERCGVGVVRGRLAVGRPTKDGRVEYGIGDLGVSPLVRFSVLNPRAAETPMQGQWQEAMFLGLLLGILTLVMWTRRAEVALPAQLPAGVVLASVWRRVLATGLDILPGFVVTMPWWYSKMNAAMMEFGLTSLSSSLTNEQMEYVAAQIRPEFYISCALYGLWCLAFEASMGTTPGKLLFSCRVLSHGGGKPSLRQFVIRNAIRSFMVAMGAPGLIIMLMSIVIVTRNRQHIGDLLARTIVVEPAPPEEERPGPDDEMGPFG